MVNKRQPSVAIVHDWLVGGGAERVVLELHKMYPDAPIYTSYISPYWQKQLSDAVVITGYLQKWPFSVLRKYIPVLRIWWFTRLDFSHYDLVISSSGNGEAKGIKTPGKTIHVNYCHAPTHFYWRHYEKYLANPGFGFFDPIARTGLKLLVGPLRSWDLRASKRPTYFIANSTHTQNDIKKYYNRESVVIYPPVDIDRFKEVHSRHRKRFVTVGRQTPYKHTDIIVSACTEINEPLVVIGTGPEHKNLKKIAGPTVKFVTNASDKVVAQYLANSKAFIFASNEDFGIAPVEALASGTPLIAYKAGGALDYVTPETGMFFLSQNTNSVIHAIRNFQPEKYNSDDIKTHAKKYSKKNFHRNFKKYLTSVIK